MSALATTSAVRSADVNVGNAVPAAAGGAGAGLAAPARAEVASSAVTDPMQEKLEELRDRRDQAYKAGSPRAVERQHAKGKMLARERIEYLLDPGSFQELDLLARHRAHAAGLEERPYTDGVITGWGTIEGRNVFVFSQDFTVFGGALGRGVRREDPQADGPRAQGRRAGGRPERRRRCPHPGGRRLAGQLRRDLLPERALVRRGAPDQRDPRAVRGRRRLLAGHDRLHLHGPGEVPHVHHRARRGPDRHRRGGDARGARWRHEPRQQVRRGDLRLARREDVPGGRALPARLPPPEQHGGAADRRVR